MTASGLVIFQIRKQQKHATYFLLQLDREENTGLCYTTLRHINEEIFPLWSKML